jgi:hypothetical protein
MSKKVPIFMKDTNCDKYMRVRGIADPIPTGSCELTRVRGRLRPPEYMNVQWLIKQDIQSLGRRGQQGVDDGLA